MMKPEVVDENKQVLQNIQQMVKNLKRESASR
jgi:hypothetical protein